MNRKAVIFSVFILFISWKSFSQIGVAYHQSSIPFIGVNTPVGDNFLPELRVGTNSYFEDISLELAVNYLLKTTTDYEVYSGLGGRIGTYEGLVIPVGVNLYPIENKNFGFHMELAGIIGDGEIIRGSWGIRYKFD